MRIILKTEERKLDKFTNGEFMNILKIKTLKQLKEINYKPVSIKNEMRKNLISFLQKKINPFEGIIGYDETVIPNIQTAILSRHNIILLGLRGQAKTKIARMLINLLDEYIPVLEGAPLNDDPFLPISKEAKDIIAKDGDSAKILWMHREERYTEKLATPDVSVADLIGDVDPIKAAALKLPYSDQRVIHFGLIPRSHRSIFVLNELPDLQARIQVALFNILQEKDIQIRGFKIRLPLDIQFVFTANPEDYTNRGSIVTPLKDRIDSQILTHYPLNISFSKIITRQEAKIIKEQKDTIITDELTDNLIEQIAFEARESDYIDSKSGVSARLTISAYENLISCAERRRILNSEKTTVLRVLDIYGVIPSITGKVELVYEGEQEGPSKVAVILIGKAIRTIFEQLLPSPDKIKNKSQNPYTRITEWFNLNNSVTLNINSSDEEYRKRLEEVKGLKELVENHFPHLNNNKKYLYMEFVLHGLAEYSLISKIKLTSGQLEFKDVFSSMFASKQSTDNDEEGLDL